MLWSCTEMTVATEKFVWHQRTYFFQIIWPGWIEMVRKVMDTLKKISFVFRLTGMVIRPPETGIITRNYIYIYYLRNYSRKLEIIICKKYVPVWYFYRRVSDILPCKFLISFAGNLGCVSPKSAASQSPIPFCTIKLYICKKFKTSETFCWNGFLRVHVMLWYFFRKFSEFV